METITIKDIARKCGVGVSTVSRAINNHPDINEDTKNMIMQVIRENNFIPNNSARNLKRQEARAIAVLIKGINNPFFQSMIKIIEEETQEKKYTFILHRVDTNEDEVEVALELIKEKRLKGIVFLGGYFSHSEEKLKQISVPFILSTIGMIGDINPAVYSSVSVDDIKESYKLVDYLCKCGHKRIAILAAGKDDFSIGKLRVDGYKMALRDNGIAVDEDLICYSNYCENSYTMKNGYHLMKDLLASGKKCTAVYGISDSIAIGASKAILEAGKQIPEDFSVAGFDGMDITYYYNPSITTIRQPVEEMARETASILFDLIRKKKSNQHRLFEAELIVRESTRQLERK